MGRAVHLASISTGRAASKSIKIQIQADFCTVSTESGNRSMTLKNIPKQHREEQKLKEAVDVTLRQNRLACNTCIASASSKPPSRLTNVSDP